ncbi:MAG: hypothetical protein R3D00_11215 [Bacteroidia bacterium]
MQKYFSILVVVLMTIALYSGCKSTKSVSYSAAGNWDFSVTNTPEGDYKGVMVLTQAEEGYTGYLEAAGSKIELKNIVIDDENKLKASLYFSGNDLDIKGTFSGESFTGFVVAGYDNFPIVAERTK